jgi:hypothetical protein
VPIRKIYFCDGSVVEEKTKGKHRNKKKKTDADLEKRGE